MIISFLSVFSVFWSLDKGFYINLTLIPFLIFIFINSKKDFFKFFFSIIAFWLIALLLLGTSSFLAFLNHSVEILTQHEYLNGIIHPQPFSDDQHSFRGMIS